MLSFLFKLQQFTFSFFFTFQDILVAHNPLQDVASQFIEGLIGGSEDGVLAGLSKFLHQTSVTSHVLQAEELGSHNPRIIMIPWPYCSGGDNYTLHDRHGERGKETRWGKYRGEERRGQERRREEKRGK